MDKITITLGVESYNTIVRGLQELPWRLANPVFQEIDPQVRAALAKEQAPVQASDGQDKTPSEV